MKIKFEKTITFVDPTINGKSTSTTTVCLSSEETDSPFISKHCISYSLKTGNTFNKNILEDILSGVDKSSILSMDLNFFYLDPTDNVSKPLFFELFEDTNEFSLGKFNSFALLCEQDFNLDLRIRNATVTAPETGAEEKLGVLSVMILSKANGESGSGFPYILPFNLS